MPTCIKCGSQIQGTNICPVCKTPVTQITKCSNCSAEFSQTFNFCPMCGTPLARKEQPELVKSSQVEMKMVTVRGGEFLMGNAKTGVNKVFVSSFCMANMPVTQYLYRKIMGTNPSKMQEALHPVESVTWYDAVIFCNMLSEAYGRSPCYKIGSVTNLQKIQPGDPAWKNITCNFSANGFRLPTEAEWEFAARGGTVHEQFVYSGSNNIDEVAWYGENSNISTHQVCQKKPNVLGLYDMSGNVEEWCWDYYGDYSLSEGSLSGPENGNLRVKRGGSWLDDDVQCTVTFRSKSAPNGKGSNLGFRICYTGM